MILAALHELVDAVRGETNERVAEVGLDSRLYAIFLRQIGWVGSPDEVRLTFAGQEVRFKLERGIRGIRVRTT